MELITLLSIVRNGTKYSVIKNNELLITRTMERIVEGSQPRRHSLSTISGTEEEIWLSRAGINLHESVLGMSIQDNHITIYI